MTDLLEIALSAYGLGELTSLTDDEVWILQRQLSAALGAVDKEVYGRYKLGEAMEGLGGAPV